MATYEIEIKSLLGEAKVAKKLKANLKKHCPDLSLVGKNKQLNHYFVGGDIAKLAELILPHIPEKEHEQLHNIVAKGSNYSVRTRDADGKVLLVIKASIDDSTSSNGVSRMEFEAQVDVSLDELDKLLLSAGFSYQAKWSREREEYKAGEINICIDRNAGYGYVAEFEKMIKDPSEAESVKSELAKFMEMLGVEELPQDRLERMFAHYNKHWNEYYGTDNVFTIE